MFLSTNAATAPITVTITHNAHQVLAVVINNSRPLNAAQQLLAGKPLTQSSAVISKLFTLCANAQTIANQLVVNALSGHGVKSTKFSQQLLAFEWLTEHSWQLFLLAKKLKIDGGLIAKTLALRKFLQACLNSPTSEMSAQLQSPALKQQLTTLLGVTPSELVNFSYLQWLAWLKNNSAPYAILLMNIMKMSQQQLERTQPTNVAVDKADLINKNNTSPSNQDLSNSEEHKNISYAIPKILVKALVKNNISNEEIAPDSCTSAEQGALPRTANSKLMHDIINHHGSGITARFFAKMFEMAQLTTAQLPPKPSVEKLSSNSALAIVAASRGDLLHKVTVIDEKVVNYCLFAPTETNFSMHSPLVNALYHLKTDNSSTLQLSAELLVASFDPCVDYQVELIYA